MMPDVGREAARTTTWSKRSRAGAALAIAVLVSFPFYGSAFHVDLACQVFLAGVGALALTLLTGYAGQISLGHAGLLAAGAFSVGILYREFQAPFWVTLPSAAVCGAVLGLVFGLPSLRLRALYLAVSTLGLHFLVVYLGGEYEARRGYSTGILIDPPRVFGMEIYGGRWWYFILLFAVSLAYLGCRNLVRSRTGRAWGAIRSNQTVAASLGVDVSRAKVVAFIITSSMTAVAGALFAYYRGFVSVEAFSLYLAIQYVAMVIVGGMRSLAGALLGALFVTVFPYLIEWLLGLLPLAEKQASAVFAANYAAFGLVMILFLTLEPKGLMGILERLAKAAARLKHRKFAP